MRILGFGRLWPKLEQEIFTTYRYPRGDKDWEVGEVVQVFLKPRSRSRVKLGVARIIGKEPRELDDSFQRRFPESLEGQVPVVTEEEAKADGFATVAEMVAYFIKQRGALDYTSLFNKLTLEWVERSA